MGEHAAEFAIENLEEKDGEIGDNQVSYTRSNEEIEMKLVVLHAGSCAHIVSVRRGDAARQKAEVLDTGLVSDRAFTMT